MIQHDMGWFEVFDRIDRHIPKECVMLGVPRGGSVVAGLALARSYEGAMGRGMTDPETARTVGKHLVIVDDIVDSGRTKEEWTARFPEARFVALVDKRARAADRKLGWVKFPWEHDGPRDAEDSVVRLLQQLGEDPAREGLRDTPKRVVKAWGEMLSGMAQDPAVILARDFAGDGYDELVVCRDIPFHSTCEHHMLPFAGVAHVGYLPRRRVVGLSKMARLVDCFARRLQVQERLTRQVADAMQAHLNPLAVGVVVQAQHSCMSCRGVMKHGTSMVTSTLLGRMRNPAMRAEFLALCGIGGAR